MKTSQSPVTPISELTTDTLLALSLPSGKPAAHVLLSHYDTLKDIDDASVEELAQLEGIGPGMALRLKAVFELGRRYYASPNGSRPRISSPVDVSKLLMDDMRLLDREQFRVLLLNAKNLVIENHLVSIGTLVNSLVHPRELFKAAIRRSAASVVLAHNHPSGDPTPSDDDIQLTRRLVQCGELLGIKVLDHVILGDRRFVSFKERGLI